MVIFWMTIQEDFASSRDVETGHFAFVDSFDKHWP